MAGSVTKSLYLQIGGDVTALTTAAKAGKSVLLSLGDAAVDVESEVKRAFADLGGSIPDQAKQIERSYADTFAAIRRNAQSVLDAPDGHAAVQVLNAGAADQAAAAAEKQAVALRQVATAASTVADRAGAAGAAERVLAVAAAAVAERAEEEALALRNQANLLGTVDAEIRAAAGGVEDAGSKVVDAHSRMGASGAILQHVVRSTTDSFAAGLPVSIIFAEQVGRLGEAAALSEGSFGKFGAIMSGPWGLAITVAISLAAQLVGKLAEGSDAVADETRKLEDNAKQTETTRQAKALFQRTTEGVAAAIRDGTEATNKAIASLKTEAEQANIAAKAHLAQEIAIRQVTAAQLEQAIAQEAALRQRALAEQQYGTRDTAGIALPQAQDQVSALQAQLAENNRLVTAAEQRLQQTHLDLVIEQADKESTAVGKITAAYDARITALKTEIEQQIRLGNVVGTASKQRLVALEQEKAAAIEAEQKREADAKKKPREVPLGRQLETEQAASILSSAQSFTGLSEHSSSGKAGLSQLFSQAGIHIDPEMTAWCAAFVNAVLATNGIKGTGSLSARSFLNYGSATDKPDKGDIVVLKRGTGSEGHVGFYSGTDSKGRVLVTGGNQGDKVSTEAFARSSVLGFRRAPTASQADKANAAAGRRGADDDRAFTNADRQLDDAIARAKQQLAGSIEDDYQLKAAQIVVDTDAKNRAIQDQVVAGKLTQAQADQLKLKTDEAGVLAEQIAAEQRRVQLANSAYQVDSDASTGRLALLQLDAALATTRRGRLDAERKILDEEQAQARRTAQHAVDVAAPGSTEQTTALAAQARLPELQAGQDKQFADQHLDALGNYKKQLHDSVGDMKDSLKSVEVDGLRGIEDGFAGIISGTETVSQAFSRMAETILSDLARIAVEKAVLSVLGFSEGGAVGSVTPEKHAGGGFISGKGSGTSDDILSWLSNGEFVMTAAATRKHLPLLKALNDGKLPGFATGGLVGQLPALPTGYPALPRAEQLRTQQQVAVKATVDVNPSPLFETQTRTIAQQTVGQAAQPIMMGAVTQTKKELRRQSLPGGYA
jgi:uncharacterized protein (TIGR02594 family)